MQAERLILKSSAFMRSRPFGVVVAILVLCLLCVASASADYGQAGNFAQSGEGEQLEWATGMAINYSGTGGVPAGSLYVTAAERVLRYTETGDFQEAWGWGVADKKEEFERCGPALKTICTSHGQAPFGGEEAGHFNTPAGVAVDQTTGDVYVLNSLSIGHREHHIVEVFSAQGAPIGEGFGDVGATPPPPEPTESIAEGPEKLHEGASTASGIAVDTAGRVYLTDRDSPFIAHLPLENRVMSFVPQSPGDYEHYVYAGRSGDIVGPNGVGFSKVALDDAGHLYGADERSVEEFSLAEPSVPLCTFNVASSSLHAMAVNAQTGEVFYFTEKDRKIHRLGVCDSGKGVFEEAQSPITVAPETTKFFALAVNPGFVWGALRPVGVLYGADSEHHETLVPPLNGSGDVFAPAEVRFPGVVSESVVDTGAVSSTLRAEVDPHGFTTRFVFQYLSEAAYEANDPADRFAGASVAPVGSGGVLEGGQKGLATATITGLTPDTEYRYRVVATSECEGAGEPVCETGGEAAVFSTFPMAVSGLPDGRGYELVSPIEKNGGEVFPADPEQGSCGGGCKPPGASAVGARFPMQSSPGGGAVVYEGQPFSASKGAAVRNEYLSRRTGSGWQTTALSPVLQGGTGLQGHVAFNSELTSGLIFQENPVLSPEAPSGYPDFYAQSTAVPGSLTALLSAAPPNLTPAGFKLGYAGHSADFSRQFFSANDALTEETPFAPVAPDPGSGESELYEWYGGRLRLVNVLPGNTTVASGAIFGSSSPDTHAISEDGSRVFWQDGNGHLYVRENGESTVEVPGSSPSAEFLAASVDGSRVLLSDGELVNVNDLAEAPVDLARGEGGFQGVMGQSEDLSRLYFVDTAVLTGEEESSQGAKAQTGQDNLYAWDEGAFRFIATLAASDGTTAVVSDWVAAPSKRTAQASPDGDWLAFLSTVPLTGYENVGPACAINSVNEFVSGSCREVFVYDSTSGVLRCASCDPTGEAPAGPSTLRLINGAEGWLPQPRYLTDTGRLFFDSADRLSPRDTNGRVEDVYEFEPDGVGTCERSGGCVSLISTGAGTSDANFLATDETGASVFFTTRERLVPSDHDELIDLYDAREGGGFANETETGASTCQGETCQPPTPSGAQGEPSASSSLFIGPGNLTPLLLQTPPPPVKPKAKALTRSQKLTRAVKACRQKPRKKRASCERAARKKYGVIANAKKAVNNNRAGGR